MKLLIKNVAIRLNGFSGVSRAGPYPAKPWRLKLRSKISGEQKMMLDRWVGRSAHGKQFPDLSSSTRWISLSYLKPLSFGKAQEF